jgi:copper ion binding protein
MTRVYDVPDISCDHCKHAIETAIGKVAGVSSVVVTVDTKSVLVEGPADDSAIRAAIDEAGYDIAGVTTD